MDTIFLVEQFHKAFKRPINKKPTIHNVEINDLRLRLLREEVQELEDALLQGTEEDVLDALIDIQYILDGSFLSLGFAHMKEKGFQVVHDANMAKLYPDGTAKIRDDGKILKPEGWQPPNLKSVVSMYYEV